MLPEWLPLGLPLPLRLALSEEMLLGPAEGEEAMVGGPPRVCVALREAAALALLCMVLPAEELREALLLGQAEREELAELLALSLGLLLTEALAVPLALPPTREGEAERVRCPALERVALPVA